MSQKKVRNATEVRYARKLLSRLTITVAFSHPHTIISLMQADSKVFSLDRIAFPSLNGLSGETHHSVSSANTNQLNRILVPLMVISCCLLLTKFRFYLFSTLQITMKKTILGME